MLADQPHACLARYGLVVLYGAQRPAAAFDHFKTVTSHFVQFVNNVPLFLESPCLDKSLPFLTLRTGD